MLLAGCSAGEEPARRSLAVSDPVVAFGTLLPGERVTRTVTVRNTGEVALAIGVTVEQGNVAVSPASLRISGGGSAPLTITASGDVAGLMRDRVQLRAGDARASIDVGGYVADAILAAPDVLDLGEVQLGERREESIVIRNLLERGYGVAAVLPEGSAFSLPGDPLFLPASRPAELEIAFDARCVGPHEASLELVPCDGCPPTEVKLAAEVQGRVVALGMDERLVLFADVPPGGRSTSGLAFSVTSCEALPLELRLEGDSFELLGERYISAGPLDIVQVELAFVPRERGHHDGSIAILGPEGELDRVALFGASGGPELVASHSTLDVGVAHAGSGVPAARDVAVSAENDHGSVDVASIAVLEGPFRAIPQRSVPTRVDSPLWITVELDPVTVGEHQGVLQILPADPRHPELRVALSGTVVDDPPCELRVAEELRFGLVPAAEPRVRTLPIHNIGQGRCFLWDLATEVEPGRVNGFSLVGHRAGILTVDPKRHLALPIAIDRRFTDSAGVLTFRRSGFSGLERVLLSASPRASLQLGAGELDLGAVRPGDVALASVDLTDQLVIGVDRAGAATAPFGTTGILPVPHQLLPGFVFPVHVTFAPDRTGPFFGEVEIAIAGELEPVRIGLLGEGLEDACAEPCVRSRASCPGPQRVLTGERVPLPGASVGAGCAWSLVGTPPDAHAALLGANSCTASLLPDVPGSYDLELRAGQDVCTTRVTAVEHGGLRIEATWETAGDVDLVLFHPSAGPIDEAASWTSVFACSSLHPAPRWEGGRSRDPRLVRHAASGTGPEEIRIEEPSSLHGYDVGVRWRASPEPARDQTVTVRTWCAGQLAATTIVDLPQLHDAAWVGTLAWSDRTCAYTEQNTLLSLQP